MTKEAPNKHDMCFFLLPLSCLIPPSFAPHSPRPPFPPPKNLREAVTRPQHELLPGRERLGFRLKHADVPRRSARDIMDSFHLGIE